MKHVDERSQEEPTLGILGELFENYSPPSWDVYFMRLSYEIATKSKDLSTKFGAVLVKDKRSIAFGYNGLPPNVKDYSERMQRPAKYKWTLHAEKNAIACAAKFGVDTNHSTLYIAGMPCAQCAAMLISSGIEKIVLHRPAVEIFTKVSPYGEENEIATTMFSEASVEVSYVDIFVDKFAYLGGRKYKL